MRIRSAEVFLLQPVPTTERDILASMSHDGSSKNGPDSSSLLQLVSGSDGLIDVGGLSAILFWGGRPTRNLP